MDKVQEGSGPRLVNAVPSDGGFEGVFRFVSVLVLSFLLVGLFSVLWGKMLLRAPVAVGPYGGDHVHGRWTPRRAVVGNTVLD